MEEPLDTTPPAELEDVMADELAAPAEAPPADEEGARLRPVLEALVYVTEDPLSVQQIAQALGTTTDKVEKALAELAAEFDKPEHGIMIREVAGGYKMTTKAEHHETVRAFVKGLKPPLKLSLAALETLSVIAYKQPITAPEIMEIRGVQGAGVLKTLLDRKLITTSGRKSVVGRPILYRTTKEFLVQFGLKELNELPTLKEFEELRRLSLTDEVEQVPDLRPEDGPSPDVSSPEAPAESPENPPEPTEE